MNTHVKPHLVVCGLVLEYKNAILKAGIDRKRLYLLSILVILNFFLILCTGTDCKSEQCGR